MKNWSLGYEALKQFVRLALWLSHKRITVIDSSKIPRNKPLIFAPNHQNALMDPLAVLCTNFTQPVWLARADIFNLNATRPILRFMKIMPVYRIRDGKENLGMNETIFSQVIEVLENKKSLALFPEAAHSGKRQMLAHKKAIPRIAFLAEEKNNFNLKLQIVPVGIYYSHYWHFNRELIVHYGDAIEVDRYQKEYQENSFQATQLLRADIEKRVEQLIINIRSKTHYENYELFRELIGPDFAKANRQIRNQAKNRFFNDQKLIRILEKKEESEPETLSDLHQKTDQLRMALKQLNCTCKQVDEGSLQSENLLVLSVFSILLLPVIVIGFLLHSIPFNIPRYFIQKKVKDPTFYSTFQFVSGMIIYLIYTITIALILLMLTHQFIWALIGLIILFAIGKLSYVSLQVVKNLIQKFRFFILYQKHKEEVKAILQLKKEVKKQLLELTSD